MMQLDALELISWARSVVEDKFSLPPAIMLTAQQTSVTKNMLIHELLTRPTHFCVSSKLSKNAKPGFDTVDLDNRALYLPGHLLNSDILGPFVAQTDVMIIGKYPGEQEAAQMRNWVGWAGQYLRSMLDDIGIDDLYTTNAIRMYRADWKKPPALGKCDISVYLMWLEVVIRRPKYILLLGAEPTKLFLGNNVSIKSCRGIPIDFSFDKYFESCDHQAIVFVTENPASLAHDMTKSESWRADMIAFGSVVSGVGVMRDVTDYKVIESEEELRTCIDLMIANNISELSIDCEWGGYRPSEGYLRTIQLSYEKGKAYVIKVRDTNGNLYFQTNSSDERIITSYLNKLLSVLSDLCLIGFNINADLHWLEYWGLDIDLVFKHPIFDVMFAHRDLYATHAHNLNDIAAQFTALGRYNDKLEEFKRQHRKSGSDDDGGYGYVPDEILFPYGASDVDATLRLKHLFNDKLTSARPLFGSRTVMDVFLTEMLALPVLYEMERNGLPVDEERINYMAVKYAEKVEELKDDFRRLVISRRLHEYAKSIQRQTGYTLKQYWHNIAVDKNDIPVETIDAIADVVISADVGRFCSMLNDDTYIKIMEVLFGDFINKLIPSKINPASSVQILEILFDWPPYGFGLQPTMSTDGTLWDQVVTDTRYDRSKSPARQEHFKPTTNAETIELLLYSDLSPEAHELVTILHGIRLVDKISGTYIPTKERRLKKKDKKDLISSIERVDGIPVIRTSLIPTPETGRLASKRPNLMTIPNRRAATIKEFLGDLPMLRTVFIAPPGWVGIAADYKSAEVYVLAALSGDSALMDAVSSDDIHSRNAVEILGAPCSVEEVKEKYKHIRVAAKTIMFGIPYQRGPAAIAREIVRNGGSCTYDEAKRLISMFYERYPKMKEFIDRMKAAVYDPGYVVTPFGRFRTFEQYEDESKMAAQQREAVNFPVQATVADMLYWAMVNVNRYCRAKHIPFKFCLTIHDCLMLLVPGEYAQVMAEDVLPKCMYELVVVPEVNLRVPIDVEIFTRWEEVPTAGDLLNRNVPSDYVDMLRGRGLVAN